MFLTNARQKLATYATAIICVMLWSATAVASSPNEVVEDATQAVAEVLGEPESPERTAQLAEAIDDNLDFGYLAERALGEHWTERTDEERDHFMDLLRRLLQHNYEDDLAGHELDEDYAVDYEEARVREDRAFVEAQIEYEDRVEPLVYRLYRTEGEWRVYDVVVDDISLEETYREGYVPIIEEHGWEGLIERMENRLEELEN